MINVKIYWKIWINLILSTIVKQQCKEMTNTPTHPTHSRRLRSIALLCLVLMKYYWLISYILSAKSGKHNIDNKLKRNKRSVRRRRKRGKKIRRKNRKRRGKSGAKNRKSGRKGNIRKSKKIGSLNSYDIYRCDV